MSHQHNEAPTEDEVPADDQPPTQGEVPADDQPPAQDGTYLEFAGTVALETTRDELWETISDPEVLANCVPGAESVERVSERRYTVEITRGVSKLTLSLSGEAEFVEMNAPEYVVTTASAFDSKTGSEFEVLAAMEMDETDDGDVALTYRAEVTYAGGAAGIDERLLRPIVERDVDTYFRNVKERVEADQ